MEPQRAYASALTSVSHIPWISTVSVSTKHTTKFTTATAIPANGKVVITFPSGFDVSSATFDSWSGFDGGRSISIAGQVVTITRDNSGTSSAAGAKYIILNNVTNHATAASSYTVTVETQDSGGTTIDGPTTSSSFSINAAGQGLANSPWPMFMGDVQHTGLSSQSGADYYTVKWRYMDIGSMHASPVIGSDGKIYIRGDYNVGNSYLYSLNPDGTRNWRYSLVTGVDYSTPAIGSDGRLYLTSSPDRKVYSINPDGTLNWMWDDNRQINAFPAIGSDGSISVTDSSNYIVVNSNGTLKCMQPNTAGNFWGGGGPVLDNNNNAYTIDTTSHFVDSFDPSCNKLWTAGPFGNFTWAPLTLDLSTETLYLTSGEYGGKATGQWLVALNMNNGEERWSLQLNDTAGGSQASWSIAADGTIYNASTSTSSADQELYAVNSNGTLAWSTPISGRTLSSSPLVDSAGRIYFGTYQPDGRIYVFNSSGTKLMSYKATSGTISIMSSIAVDANGVLYFGTTAHGGYLHDGFYAMTPWTLTASVNPSGYYKIGDTITITATTSMLQTDPSDPGENNQVQAVMPNGDKVTLSYVSSSGGNTTWQGTWTVPAGTADGSYTGTIEAAAYNVVTDVTTHFDSPPTGSSNTGITSAFTYVVDSTIPNSFVLTSPSNYSTITDEAPTFVWETVTDATTSIVRYELVIDGVKRADNISSTVNSWTLPESMSLASGSHTWYVNAIDTTGNVRRSNQEFVFIVDFSSLTPTPTPTSTPTPTPTSTPTPTPTPTPTVTLTPTPTPIPDTTPPELNLKKIGILDYSINYPTYYYTGATPLFYGTGETGATVTLKVNDTNHTTVPIINENGEWSIGDYTFTTGTHEIQLTAKDAAGNQTLIAFNLVVDPTMSVFPQSIIDLITGTSITPTPISIPLPISPTGWPEQVTPPVPTPTLQLPTGMVGEGETPGIQGNTLTVKLLDSKDKPLVGIVVTLASEKQTAMTNEFGEVTFRKVMPGEHTLSFEYKGQTIERSLNLQNDEQDFHLDIRVEAVTPAGFLLGLPWWGWATGVILILLLIFFVFIYSRNPKTPIEY